MDYKARFEELSQELSKRCAELITLRSKLLEVRMALHEFYAAEVEREKKKAFAAGYQKGWEEARKESSWNE